LVYVITAIVIIFDQVIKAIIRSTMLVGDSIPLISGVIHLTHVKNPGAAFGILPNHRVIFFIVSIAVVASLFIYYRRLKEADTLTTLSVGLVMGGAVGNLIDRLSAGVVTDFIDFRFWPVFNIADSAIVVGVVLLGIILLRDTKHEQLEIE